MKEKISYQRRDYEAVADAPRSKTIQGKNQLRVKQIVQILCTTSRGCM